MKRLLAAAVFLIAPAVLLSEPTMPAWLENYPGVTASSQTYPAVVETDYTTAAAPAAIREHYRKLFEAQGLAFQPGYDGMGTSIRATAPECGLLITIRRGRTGTQVSVSCAVQSQASAAGTASSPTVITGSGPHSRSSMSPQQSRAEHEARVAAGMEQHQQRVAELGIHKTREDAPAPPLIWPDWLVHLKGAALSIQQGVDQSHENYLKARFKTTAPMTEIFNFYKDALTAHDYPVYSSKLGTGQTTSGIQQNADGYVEGCYPSGHPGPRTVIRVSFSRFYLNEPITVDIRFTTYAYKAPRWEQR